MGRIKAKHNSVPKANFLLPLTVFYSFITKPNK